MVASGLVVSLVTSGYAAGAENASQQKAAAYLADKLAGCWIIPVGDELVATRVKSALTGMVRWRRRRRYSILQQNHRARSSMTAQFGRLPVVRPSLALRFMPIATRLGARRRSISTAE